MGRDHQPSLYRVVMHVVDLLNPLFLRKNVKRDIAPLPQAMVGIAVDGGGESQPDQQGSAPGCVLIPGEGGDDLLGRSLLQFLHEADSSLGGFGFYQQMKVLGH